MKKYLTAFIFASFMMFLTSTQAHAYSAKWSYEDGGGIFTNTTVPVDVAKAGTGETNVDLSTLKSGEAVARNILYLVETGDASIDEAARKGGITKIKYVDSKTCKVYIPLGFIPILVKETKTIVYGE